MRVITGTARGKRLLTLDGLDVRPTTGKVKEAVFSMLQFQIEGRVFLDLFAGSGQMGIEALSRGARAVYFVDNRKNALEIIKKNLENTKLAANARVISGDCIAFLSRIAGNTSFDIIYADPPYDKGTGEALLKFVGQVLNPGGVFVCEHAAEDVMPDEAYGLVKVKEHCYGTSTITNYEWSRE